MIVLPSTLRRPRGLLPIGSPTKILEAFLLSSIWLHDQSTLIILAILDEFLIVNFFPFLVLILLTSFLKIRD